MRPARFAPKQAGLFTLMACARDCSQMKYEIQWGPADEATARYAGHLNRALLDKVDAQLCSDARFDKVKKLIFDFSSVDTFDTTMEDVEELAYTNSVVGSYKNHLYCAYIAPPDADLRRQLEHYVAVIKGLNQRWAFRIFDDLAEARNWLAGF